jgi:HTH-type transcriptional regulator, transcriptional repressor of NAD biosynthesis genes
MTFGRSVVIGKFYPPHRGHKHLIDSATARSRRVVVIVCERPTDTIPGESRAAWLREIHPAADVMVIDDRYDENDTAVWAANTLGWLGGPPDAVFTSEDYGEPYARAIGCVHVSVDRDRVTVPCSGREIRHDPFANWDFLEPPVRAHFAKHVCVVGAESTGTTTLAQALATHYGTPWVPEYGREYSAEKFARGETEWKTAEFVHIANEQTRRAEAAARGANRVLIEDTNAFATRLWHRRYVGFESDAVRELAERTRCDLYLLTGDEIPFVQDGLRDGEHIRHAMHGWFADALRAQPIPWLLVRGSHDERMKVAVAAVDSLFAGSAWRAPG